MATAALISLFSNLWILAKEELDGFRHISYPIEYTQLADFPNPSYRLLSTGSHTWTTPLVGHFTTPFSQMIPDGVAWGIASEIDRFEPMALFSLPSKEFLVEGNTVRNTMIIVKAFC